MLVPTIKPVCPTGTHNYDTTAVGGTWYKYEYRLLLARHETPKWTLVYMLHTAGVPYLVQQKCQYTWYAPDVRVYSEVAPLEERNSYQDGGWKHFRRSPLQSQYSSSVKPSGKKPETRHYTWYQVYRPATKYCTFLFSRSEKGVYW